MKPVIEEATVICYKDDWDGERPSSLSAREHKFIETYLPDSISVKGKVLFRNWICLRQYDRAGNKTSELGISQSDIFRKKWQFEYFPDGVTIHTRREETFNGLDEIEFDDKGEEMRRLVYSYDENGDLELVNIYRRQPRRFNKNGLPTIIDLMIDQDRPGTQHKPYIESVIRRQYNRDGLITRELEYHPLDEISDCIFNPLQFKQWAYDKNGRVSEFQTRDRFHGDEINIHRDFRYNEDGTIRRCKQTGRNYYGRDSISYYEYDQYGNWITCSCYALENNELIEVKKRTIKYYDE